MVEDGTGLCPNCGAMMGRTNTVVWPPPLPPAACPRCNGGLPPNAAVCPHCGLRFAPDRSQDKRKWLIAGTTCGVTALIVGIVMVIFVMVVLVVGWEFIKTIAKWL